MGVYIKGMKMPIKKNGTVIIVYPDGRTFTSDEKLQAVELPPHGRLIDADALEHDVQKRLLMCDKYDNQFQKPYEVMRAIALAPTANEADHE